MRLINTTTLQLEKFENIKNRPEYAILSHRWIEGEEVRFQDMLQPHRKWLPGWKKIVFCCEQARKDGFNYAWVDTCCINQESSSELSEAINSMYNWYANAATCYAYLQDIKETSITTLSEVAAYIAKSTWFTRAWTLQELIAPPTVTFYDCNFNELGNRNVLASALETIIHIPVTVLLYPPHMKSQPVAVKMSWASNREATRVEDIAYSLFGLFQVNMPLLYGEGDRAFIRLQEEIIRQSDDHSIFIWRNPQLKHYMPILAPSPKHFETCREIYRSRRQDTKPYAMTNVGLQIELPLLPYHLDTYLALLDCEQEDAQVGILLAKDTRNIGSWYRTCVDVDVVTLPPDYTLQQPNWRNIHITKNPVPSLARALSTPSSFYGIKIDAPAFLHHSPNAVRPYALMAYDDWRSPSQGLIPTDQGQDTNLLSPTSFNHFSQFFTQTIPAEKLPVHRGKTYSVNPRSSRERSKAGATEIGILEMPTMARGISGVVFFDRLVHGIRAIKVGFDFDFRPVVFLATHEAGDDPQMQSWMRKWRFKHIDDFANSAYLQRDLHRDTNDFWRLHPDALSTDHDHTSAAKILQGVYAFRSMDPYNRDHWTFKPFEDENWHIALTLQKRTLNNLTAWELKMVREEQAIGFNLQIDPADYI